MFGQICDAFVALARLLAELVEKSIRLPWLNILAWNQQHQRQHIRNSRKRGIPLVYEFDAMKILSTDSIRKQMTVKMTCYARPGYQNVGSRKVAASQQKLLENRNGKRGGVGVEEEMSTPAVAPSEPTSRLSGHKA
ncbi:2-oxoacid:ferredoxin oxidoreductase 2,subunit alpha [Trichinella pseudospiralis]